MTANEMSPRARGLATRARRRVEARGFAKTLSALALALALPVLPGLGGCGTEEEPRALAKRRTTQAICDHEASCQLIGPGLTYETRQDCELVAQGNLELLWPREACEDRVSASDLERCIGDVRQAPCLTASDFYAELAKCQPAFVCTTPAAP